MCDNTDCADCCGVPNGDGSDVMEHAVLADLIFLRVLATAMAMSLMNACGGTGIPEALVTATAMSSMNVAFMEGIPEGFCDCDGNVIDECGVCGGTGIPSGFCDCVGNAPTTAACVVTTLVVPIDDTHSTVSGCSGNDGMATAFVSAVLLQNQALSILYEYMSIGPEIYCIMANDPFSCTCGEKFGATR